MYRVKDAADQALGSVDTAAGSGVDGGARGNLIAAIHATAIPPTAKCGDKLVLRIQIVSATSPYLEFLVQLTTP